MSDRHVVVYIAADPQQAHMLRNLLAESGIDSFVSNETLNSVHFAPGDWMVRAAGGPGFLPMAPKVVVHEDDAEEAREIVLSAEKQMLAGAPAPELIALEAESGEEQAWPMCPHCARPRLATCPVCKTSGVDFAAAFLPEQLNADEDAPAMVLCPTCDEAFAPGIRRGASGAAIGLPTDSTRQTVNAGRFRFRRSGAALPINSTAEPSC